MHGSEINIFISYNRNNSHFANQLYQHLREVRYSIWMDIRRIEGGYNWQRKLQEALDNSEVILVIMSPQVSKSKYVQLEYNYAMTKGKPVIVLQHIACDIPLELRDQPLIDFSKQEFQEGFSLLLAKLQELHIDPNDVIVKQEPRSPGIFFTPHSWVMSLFLLSVLLIGLFILYHNVHTNSTSSIPSQHSTTTQKFKEYPIANAAGFVYALAKGSDNSIWVTVQNNSPATSYAIAKVSENGTSQIFQVNLSSYLTTIVQGPDNALWFAGDDRNHIGRITYDGSVQFYDLPDPKAYPTYLCFGSDGSLWFTMLSSDSIGRRFPDGTFKEYPLSQNSVTGVNGIAPLEITQGPDGSMWFTESGASKIGYITSSGQVHEFTTLTATSKPWGITTGPDGNIWFTESGVNQIGRITPVGVVTEYVIPTPQNAGTPTDIIVGLDHHLWFTESGINAIGSMDVNGNYTQYNIPTNASNPQSLTIGPNGNIWFVESHTNQIGELLSNPI